MGSLLLLVMSGLPVLLLGQSFFLEKALDLVLEMRLAALWGTSAQRDMYLLASSVLVPAGMLELAAIPLIVDLRRRGAPGERDVMASLVTATVLFTAVTAGMALAVWWFSGAHGVSAGEMFLAIGAFGLAGVGMGLLSIAAAQRIADRQFVFVAARVPLIRATILGAAFVLPLGIAAPAVGAVAAAGVLVFAIWSRLELARWWRPRVSGLAVAAGVLVLNAYPVIPRLLIERPLLGALGDGTLATLDFAEKTTVILGLAGYAIVGVATASLSGATSSYRRRAAIVALLLTPAAIAMGVFAAPVVSLLFERGAFSASDSAAVTELTRLLAPSIPFVAALPLLVPGVQERGALKQGAALVAAGLLAHTLVTAYTCRTGDARPLAIAFDVVYVLLFAGFYALAGGARRSQLGGEALFGGVPPLDG
ncbi:MAG: hypothetical protein WEB04_08525 [Dehalococcoidia bacterium]